jgi:hypothetical protein
MARTRRNRHRTKSNRTRRNKNFIKKTFKTGMNSVTTTSKKYMPKVKSGLENVGSKVTKTATKTIPVLQKTTRNLFSMLGLKKRSRK